MCIDCSIDLCASCQSSHAMTAHASSIVRMTCYSWPPQSDVASAVASCSQCSLEVKCRLECSDCLQCICLACSAIPQRRQPWFRHRDQHQRIRGFICLLPPSQNVALPVDRECECMTVTGCLSHCERCSNGMLSFVSVCVRETCCSALCWYWRRGFFCPATWGCGIFASSSMKQS